MSTLRKVGFDNFLKAKIIANKPLIIRPEFGFAGSCTSKVFLKIFDHLTEFPPLHLAPNFTRMGLIKYFYADKLLLLLSLCACWTSAATEESGNSTRTSHRSSAASTAQEDIIPSPRQLNLSPGFNKLVDYFFVFLMFRKSGELHSISGIFFYTNFRDYFCLV